LYKEQVPPQATVLTLLTIMSKDDEYDYLFKGESTHQLLKLTVYCKCSTSCWTWSWCNCKSNSKWKCNL